MTSLLPDVQTLVDPCNNPPHYFLVSCMDYRQMDDIVYCLKCDAIPGTTEKTQEDDYDHFVLAGCSLGVTQTQYPQWSQTFWDHLITAKTKLHTNIHTVLLVEHEDCGAYRLFLNNGNQFEPHEEENHHRRYAHALKRLIQSHPNPTIRSLQVQTLIMRRLSPNQNNKWIMTSLPEEQVEPK